MSESRFKSILAILVESDFRAHLELALCSNYTLEELAEQRDAKVKILKERVSIFDFMYNEIIY